MQIYQPYTYLIRFKPTGQLYYGAKYAVGCHPDQFWVKYFTSSKVVEKLIAEFGIDSFEVLYTKNHATGKAALGWEEMYLISVDAGRNGDYLNVHNGGKNFIVLSGEGNNFFGKHHSNNTKAVLSEIFSGEGSAMWGKFGENHPAFGLKRTEEQLKKISGENHWAFGLTGELCHMFGKIHTEDWCSQHSNMMSGEGNPMFGKTGELCPMFGKTGTDHPMFGYKYTDIQIEARSERMVGEKNHQFGKTGELSPNSKIYIVTSKDETKEIIMGLRQFCKEHNLASGTMTLVAQGKRKQHKGYKCRYATEEEILLWT